MKLHESDRISNCFRAGLSWSLGVVCGLAVICGIVGGRAAFCEEPPAPQWKFAVGKWYRWEDPNKEMWDAVDIATSQDKQKVTFLSQVAPFLKLEHFEAILFSEGAKVMPLPLVLVAESESMSTRSIRAGTRVRSCDYTILGQTTSALSPNEEIDSVHRAEGRANVRLRFTEGRWRCDEVRLECAAGTGKELEVDDLGGAHVRLRARFRRRRARKLTIREE